MQSLVTLASKVVADNYPVEIALNLPIELRERLQIYYNKEIQVEYFGSWHFEQKFDNIPCAIKAVYQGKYTTVYLRSLVRGFVSEFLLYNGQLHGEFIFYDKDGGVCIETYKLGKILSNKRIFPDGTLHYSINYTGGRRELMYLKPGGKGQIDSYGYYSKPHNCYVQLVQQGKLVNRITNLSKHTTRELPDWIGELIALI